MPQRPDDGLDYPWSEAPAGGEMRQVADGVFWLRMPLPFQLDHINLWLLEDEDGWTLVDSGFPTEETQVLWVRLLAGPAAGRPPRRLICTHYHPDHAGLSGWLVARHGLAFQMTRTEWLTAQMLRCLPDADFAAAQSAFYRRHGLDEERLARLAARGNGYAKRVKSIPLAYGRLRHGQDVAIGGRTWTVIVGEGHAPEHASLYCPELQVLIAGDQILPQITPNISTPWYAPDASPLDDYLASFRRFAGLPPATLVLPSHRLPFRGLASRIEVLKHHHDARLAEACDACRDGAKSAAELLPVLFRRQLDDHQLSFAMGEAVAHLTHLEQQGRLASAPGGDAVVRFRAA